jgi:hypothetical protein
MARRVNGYPGAEEAIPDHLAGVKPLSPKSFGNGVKRFKIKQALPGQKKYTRPLQTCRVALFTFIKLSQLSPISFEMEEGT